MITELGRFGRVETGRKMYIIECCTLIADDLSPVMILPRLLCRKLGKLQRARGRLPRVGWATIG